MSQLPADDPTTRLFLRHALATLAYRAGKAVRGTTAEFADFRAPQPDPQWKSNSPREILAHMGDLMDWVLTQLQGHQKWNNSTPLEWQAEIRRFFAALTAVDQHLATGKPIAYDPGKMFQGGIADALTHTGQLTMLRRLSGHKMKGESYAQADIEIGKTTLEQTPANPKYEFD
jgi:hypothetical protein